jgi:myo-inositol-1(or 4)-monophosphatase
MKFQNELICAKKTAYLAGKYLLENFNSIKNISSNRGKDLKLELDINTENLIKNTLSEEYNYPFLAEESDNSHIKQEGLYWVIDPLDGTYNYFRGIKNSAVCIALCEGEIPVLGVIYDFFNDKMIYGTIDGSAFVNDEEVNLVQAESVGQAALATGFPVNKDLSPKSLEKFINKATAFKKVRMFGAASISLAAIVQNQVDAYWEESIMLWDVAAGLAIVSAAGGYISLSPIGTDYCYDVVATNDKKSLDFIIKE